MTVSSQTNNVTFVGNGSATAFPLPFRFFSNGDIFAYFIDSISGASTPMVLGTDYTLIGAGEPEVDGSALSLLTTTVPLASMRGLYVERVISQVQETDIVNQGQFFASTHEDVFDRLTMLIQQANANSNWAIRVAIGDPEPTRLPNAILRANLLMSFDGSGNPIAVAPVSGSATDLAINLANKIDPAKGSSLVGYKGRTMDKKAEDIVSVLDGFGVVADGVTDDTAAFTAANNASLSLYIPPGVYKLDKFTPRMGSTITGAGIDACLLTSPAGSNPLQINYRLITVEKMTISLPPTADGIVCGTRGGAGGAGALFAQTCIFRDMRIVGGNDGVRIYGSNTSTFDTLFIESCTTGVRITPVSAGNTNGNKLSAVGVYGCNQALVALPNMDAGISTAHNNMDIYAEACTGAAGPVFKFTGYDNSLDLYPDSNSGTIFDLGTGNVLRLRDAMNAVTAEMAKGNVMVYAVGGTVRDGSNFTVKQPVPLAQFSAGGGQIDTSLTSGNGSSSIVRVQNLNTGGSGETLILNTMADVPTGFELTLVHVVSAPGFYLAAPSYGGPWTLLNWPAGGGYALQFSAYTKCKIVKVSSNTLMFLL